MESFDLTGCGLERFLVFQYHHPIFTVRHRPFSYKRVNVLRCHGDWSKDMKWFKTNLLETEERTNIELDIGSFRIRTIHNDV